MMYVYLSVCIVITYRRVWIYWYGVRLSTLPMASISLSPFAPENLVSRDGLAFPSRVSLLILHTQAETGAYSRHSSRFLWWHPFIYTAKRYRASPDFTGSRNCVKMAFTAESPSPQGQWPSRQLKLPVLPLHHNGPFDVRLSFPTPNIGMKWAY